MSEFFNKKEDVIDIQLTRLGKQELVKGIFDPTYYKFFDDNILYDQKYVTGSMNDDQFGYFKNRLDETQNLKIFPNISSVEFNKNIDTQTLFSVLGTSKAGEQKYPAFRVNFLDGEISGTVLLQTGTFVSDKIPQINCELNLVYDRNNKLINDKSIFLRIDEINGIYQKENFEIEISEILETTSSNGEVITTYKPLEFINIDRYEEGISETFIGDETINLEDFSEGFPEIKPEHVEYFFNILCDYEINYEIFTESENNDLYEIHHINDEEKVNC